MDRNSPLKRVRKDADRNRRRLIQVASEVFQEQGLAASLAEIARRAEVGIGTLYRHFPGRDDLVQAIVADDLDHLLQLAAQALTADDPWQALSDFCMAQTEQGSRRRVIRELVILHDARPSGSEFFASLEQLVQRAHDSRQLRPDVVAQDFILILSAMARVVEVTAGHAGTVDPWRRILELALDGTRANGERTELSAPPLTVPQLERGMHHLAQRNLAQSGRRPRTDQEN